MKKILFVAACVGVLSGCGSSSSDGGSVGEQSNNIANDDLELVANNIERVIAYKGKNFKLVGNNNSIRISDDLRKLTISGDSNTFYFTDGVNIGACEVIGNNNKTATKPAGLSCVVNGNGNIGF